MEIQLYSYSRALIKTDKHRPITTLYQEKINMNHHKLVNKLSCASKKKKKKINNVIKYNVNLNYTVHISS